MDGALDYFSRIDQMGGMVSAIEEGFPQREIADSAYRFQQAVERHDKVIVGVNDYVQEGGRGIETLYVDESAGDQPAGAAGGDQGDERCRAGAADARRVCAPAPASTANLMPLILDAVRAYATLGEMCDALREVWGEYVETPTI